MLSFVEADHDCVDTFFVVEFAPRRSGVAEVDGGFGAGWQFRDGFVDYWALCGAPAKLVGGSLNAHHLRFGLYLPT